MMLFTVKELLKSLSALLGLLCTNMRIIMIDTIGLSIPFGRYTVFDPAFFTPSFSKINPDDNEQITQFLKDKKGIQSYRLNPKKKLKEQGLTYPNITIYETYKRNSGYQCNLKPHISIPKMLFGHSIEEVNNSNYQEAVNTLQSRLKEMGVYVFENAIHEASVTTLHYCMNILMQSEADARRFLYALNRMTLDDRYENHSRDYANGGKAVRFHTDTFEFISYLKYYDFLENGMNRIDRKPTLQERAIAKKLSKAKTLPPLIRIEIRFNGKPSIRKHLRTITGVDKQTWTFRNVFDEGISRKVIQFYWHKLMEKPANQMMLMQFSREDVYRKARENFQKIPQRILDATIGSFERLQAEGALLHKEDTLKAYSRSKYYKDQKQIITFLQANNLTSNDNLVRFMDSAVYQKPMQLGLPI